MKARIFLAVALALALLPVKSYAQMDERKPGIYAVVGQTSSPLLYSYNSAGSGSVGVMGVSISHNVYKYSGETSGVIASDTLVLVIDPNKTRGVVSRKKFDLFIKGMNPDNMLIIPLTVNLKKQRREYDEGTSVGIANAQVNTAKLDRYPFEWEQISDNSFLIKVADLTPGEYAVVFRLSKLGRFDFNAIHGFTIPEQESQPQDVQQELLTPSVE